MVHYLWSISLTLYYFVETFFRRHYFDGTARDPTKRTYHDKSVKVTLFVQNYPLIKDRQNKENRLFCKNKLRQNRLSSSFSIPKPEKFKVNDRVY